MRVVGTGPVDYTPDHKPAITVSLEEFREKKATLRIDGHEEDVFYLGYGGSAGFCLGEGHSYRYDLSFSSQDPVARRQRTAAFRRDAVDAFRALISNPETREEQIHQFFLKNAFILYHFFPVKGCLVHGEIYSKVPLGNHHVTDFVGHWCNTAGDNYVLIEIEHASHSLFTKNGDPSAALTHAIRQTQDWHTWISDNSAYAREILPGLESAVSLVFIGRRHTLSKRDKRRLRQMNDSYKGCPYISTFDAILDSNDYNRTGGLGIGFQILPGNATKYLEPSDRRLPLKLRARPSVA